VNVVIVSISQESRAATVTSPRLHTDRWVGLPAPPRRMSKVEKDALLRTPLTAVPRPEDQSSRASDQQDNSPQG
jgi:hypothetical protein